MRYISAFAMVAMLTGEAALAASIDDLDPRIEALEKENAALKKRLRIDALERENAALKRRLNLAAPADSKPRREPTTSPSANLSEKPIVGAYAMAPVVPIGPDLPPSWSGLYFGTSFGVGRLSAQEADNTISVSSSYQSFDFGTNFGTFESSNQNSSVANLRGAHVGAIASLSLGLETTLGRYFVAGVQAEGGLSNIQARLTGTSLPTSTSSSTSISTSRCPACVPPNPTFTSTSTSTSTGVNSAADTLASRWLVSALARAGFLIDPTDLVYILGGWTYAGFETPQNHGSFGLHGGSIGAGFEKRISPLWSIKAEYRYTKFQGKTIDLPYTSTSTSTGTGSTSTFVSTSNNAAHFSADMHTAFVGVSRYFVSY